MSTQEVIKEQKSSIWWFKVANWLLDFPSLKNNVIFKATFRAAIEFNKDKLSEAIKEGNRVYKEFDEIDEQLDGNQRELKNNLGEVLEEANLLSKKFDEDEEGENEKKLKNTIIEMLKLSQEFFKILDTRPERYPAEEPGYAE